jgi:hypothetical protein
LALVSRRVRIAIGGTLLAASAIMGNASPALANTNTELNVPVTFGVHGTSGWAILPTTFTAGDCRQIGANQQPDHAASDIYIKQDVDNPSRYKVTWEADLYTISNAWISFDVWHAWFVFKKDPSDEGFQLHFDGPNMQQGTFYVFQSSAYVYMSADEFHNLRYIDFGGDC